MIREYFRSCLLPLTRTNAPTDSVTSRDVQQLTAAMERVATTMAILVQELHKESGEHVLPSRTIGAPAPSRSTVPKRKK